MLQPLHAEVLSSHTTVYRARDTVSKILADYLRIRMRKNMDLSTPEGFDQAVARLAAQLQEAVRPNEEAAIRAAMKELALDFGRYSETQRQQIIDRASRELARRVPRTPTLADAVFAGASAEVLDATRTFVRATQGLNIGADFNALDVRVIRHLRTSQANFVRDEYGRRVAAFSVEARRIVGKGLESGLGRDDIARLLEKAATDRLLRRSSFYWDVVAGSFIGLGRSYGQLSAYAEAGIQHYVFEAVLDERTTETCRFLHGKRFAVSDGLKHFARVERLEGPEAIKTAQPWVREGKDPETGNTVLYIKRGQHRTRIAEVVRSGSGRRDDRGEFERGRSERELTDLGVSLPPLHGLCRTQTVAEVR